MNEMEHACKAIRDAKPIVFLPELEFPLKAAYRRFGTSSQACGKNTTHSAWKPQTRSGKTLHWFGAGTYGGVIFAPIHARRTRCGPNVDIGIFDPASDKLCCIQPWH